MPKGFITVTIGGVQVQQVRVMPAAHPGKCCRSGSLFQRGALIGYKSRDALTGDQVASLFPNRRPSHVTVILTPEELNPTPRADVVLPVPSEIVSCQPDAHFLHPFVPSVGGVISQHTAAYSCGRLGQGEQSRVHQHDPAELDRCRHLATEAADRLNAPWLGEEEREYGDEGPVPPCRPYFATAVIGEPVPHEMDETLIRTVFGGTIHPNVIINLTPLEQHQGKWPPLLAFGVNPSRHEELVEACDAFGRWFHAVEGLRDHSFVEIGGGEPEPGAVKPRLIVALTSSGSLVGAASYVVHA